MTLTSMLPSPLTSSISKLKLPSALSSTSSFLANSSSKLTNTVFVDKEALQIDLKRRLDNCRLLESGNYTCADCAQSKPEWVSLIQTPGTGKGAETYEAAALVCNKCCNYHLQLGRGICVVKNTKTIQDWTADQVRILEESGNVRVNALYEARLDPAVKERIASLQGTREQNARCCFVDEKYRQRMYYSDGESEGGPIDSVNQDFESSRKNVEPVTTTNQSVDIMDDLDDCEDDCSVKDAFILNLLEKSMGNVTPRSASGRQSFNALSASGTIEYDEDDDETSEGYMPKDDNEIDSGDDDIPSSSALGYGEDNNSRDHEVALLLARKAVPSRQRSRQRRPSNSQSNPRHRGSSLQRRSSGKVNGDLSRNESMHDSSTYSMSSSSQRRSRRGSSKTCARRREPGLEDSSSHSLSESARRRRRGSARGEERRRSISKSSQQQADEGGVERRASIGGPKGDAKLEWRGGVSSDASRRNSLGGRSSSSTRRHSMGGSTRKCYDREAEWRSLNISSHDDDSEQEEDLLPEEPTFKQKLRRCKSMECTPGEDKTMKRTHTNNKASTKGERTKILRRSKSSIGEEDRKILRRRGLMRSHSAILVEGKEPRKSKQRRRSARSSDGNTEQHAGDDSLKQYSSGRSDALKMRKCKSISDLRHRQDHAMPESRRRPKRRPSRGTEPTDNHMGWKNGSFNTKARNDDNSDSACFDWDAWRRIDRDVVHTQAPKNSGRGQLQRSASFNWNAWRKSSRDLGAGGDSDNDAKFDTITAKDTRRGKMRKSNSMRIERKSHDGHNVVVEEKENAKTRRHPEPKEDGNRRRKSTKSKSNNNHDDDEVDSLDQDDSSVENDASDGSGCHSGQHSDSGGKGRCRSNKSKKGMSKAVQRREAMVDLFSSFSS